MDTPIESNTDISARPSPQKRSSHTNSKRLAVGLLVVFLIAGGIYGTYYWQHKKVNDLNNEINTLSSQTSSSHTSGSQSENKLATSNSTTYTQDTELGIDNLVMRGKEVLTTLYLPPNMDVLPYSMDVNSETNGYASYYTDVNGLIARWLFDPQGTISSPSPSSGGQDELFVSVMTTWQNTNDTSPVGYFGSLSTGSEMTASQKASFIQQLKAQTASCATNGSAGFTTNDKVFKVCYTLVSSHAAGVGPELQLTGFGELAGNPIYLGGRIFLPLNYKADLGNYLNVLPKISTTIQPNPNVN